MSNLIQIVEELQSKRSQLHHELTRVDAAIEALRGIDGRKSTTKAVPTAVDAPKPKRVLSLGARRRIAAAQRARWAKVRAQKKAA